MHEGNETVRRVGCAVIECRGSLLIAQRNYGDSFGGYWEFPGGSCEPGESVEDCLCREVFEELGIEIRPRKLIEITRVRKPGRLLELYFYLCGWVAGLPRKRDCLDFRWVFPEDLGRFLFLPSDRSIIRELRYRKAYYFDPLRFWGGREFRFPGPAKEG